MPKVVRDGVLWMGGLADYMTSKFLRDGFLSLGEDDVEEVEIVRNKFTGKPAGYGFVYFDTDASALMAMHKLNGKTIPNSQPPIRFQLNHSSAQAQGNNPFSQREFSIWVTDLPENCTDEQLRRTFSTRFDSIRVARVQTDSSHGKKPYGFVRFGSQEEQRDALIHMNGFRGMGDKPIKVSMAIPKNKPGGKDEEVGTRGGQKEYSYYYESYWADQAAWGNFASLPGLTHPANRVGHSGTKQFIHTVRQNADNADTFHAPVNDDWLEDSEDEDRIIEWDTPVNVDAMNKTFMERSLEAWDGIERDRWLYSFDTEDSIIPDFDKPVGGGLVKKATEQDFEDSLFRDLGDTEQTEEDEYINLVGAPL